MLLTTLTLDPSMLICHIQPVTSITVNCSLARPCKVIHNYFPSILFFKLTWTILLSVAPIATSKSTVEVLIPAGVWSVLLLWELDFDFEDGVHSMQLKVGGFDTISRRKVSVFRSQNSNGLSLYFTTRYCLLIAQHRLSSGH